MSRTLKRLQSLGAKAGAFALSGVLALSMTPAIALANDELTASASDALTVADATQVATSSYANTIAGGTKNIIGKNGDALNGTVQPVTSGTDENNHTYQYMGYAHSDNGGHYQAYSLYTQLKTDDNGILTSIDLTSGNDTFAGKWGYQQAKVPSEGSTKKGGQTSKVVPIEGFLPVGVEFVVTKDGGIYTAKLTGANQMGYTIYQVEYIPVTAAANDGSTTYSAGASKKAITARTTGERGNKTTTYTWGEDLTIGSTASGTTDDSTLTGDLTIAIPTADENVVYNLVKCTYIIGSEQTAFNVYFCADDVAKQYVDQKITATSWTDDPVQAESNGVNYTTNRDGWTAIMGSVMMRELASWGAAMANPSLSTDLDGELGGIDTVSGATKTSVPFVEALVAAQKAGYIKGVSEDLEFTIDGANGTNVSSLPRLTVSNASESQDQTTITTDEDGNYTANVVFKPKGGGRLTLNSISLYKLGGRTLGTQGMMTLAKQGTPAEGEQAGEEVYSAAKTYKIGVGYGTAKDGYVTLDSDVSDDDAGFTYKTSGDYKFVVKNKDVTHIVANYTVGHGTIAVAYDLENMAKVASVNETLAAATSGDATKVTAARTAYDALPYDVRPFTTGIATLHTAEAGVVSAQLDAVSTSDEAGVKSARAAYDALDAKAKAQVASESYEKLTSAEADIAKHTVESVSLARTAYAYSGSPNKPAVTVKAADGSIIDASNYTVDYANNTNAGSATVTVKGKGDYTGSAKATFTIAPQKIGVPVAVTGLVYTGAALTGVAAGAGYTVSGGSATNAGVYAATVALKDAKNYMWADGSTRAKSVSFTIGKAAQTIAPAKAYKVKYKKVKKKAQKVSVKFKANGGGKVTYTAAKKGKVSIAKNGKVTVKKGTKKGTYTLNVKVTAAAKGNYAKTTKTVKLKVKVA